MKRGIIGALLLVSSISGCMSTNDPPETGGMRANYGQSFGPPSVPGVKGPYNENIPMAAPYNMAPPGSEHAARMMMSRSIPMNMLQMHPNGGMTPPGMPPMPGMMPGVPGAPGPMPPGMMPGGMPGMHPGMMPPGANPLQKASLAGFMPEGGVINANVPPGGAGNGVKQAQFASSPTGPQFPAQRTQVYFAKPAGMKIFWFTQGADGKPTYSTTPLEAPGRYNFAQGAIYRLKMTHIPGRPALELYPTLEVVPTGPKTNEFLAHNRVPVEFTDEDFKQVIDGNYIVKVIYLPDPQFQDAAGAGPDEIISTRLEPGQDPIQEALRRGSILLVLRIGNIDQGLQHSPAMTSPVPGGPPASLKPPAQGVPGLFQVPSPTPPITPGGIAPPPATSTLPPFPGLTPPTLTLPLPPQVKPNVPKDDKKPEPLPEPKKDGNKLVVPPLDLPPPPGLKLDGAAKPDVPPVLTPKNDLPLLPPPPPALTPNKDKGASSATAPPVVPAVAPQLPPVTLPALDANAPVRPDLPVIPTLPSVGGKK